MPFPSCFVSNGAVTGVFLVAAGFLSADGTRHPATAWEAWLPADWAEKLPGVTVLPLVDSNPAGSSEVGTRNEPSAWTIGANQAVATYTVRQKTAQELAAQLASAKAAAIDRVNAEAGACRRLFITDVSGQEGTYIVKGEEAKAYAALVAANGTPNPADYPYLSSEAEHTGATLTSVAALVSATAAAWTPINALIEGLRRGAVVAIGIATTVAQVDAVFPILWPPA